jgi:hypothetical protein
MNDTIEIRVTRPSLYPSARLKWPTERLNITIFKRFVNGEWIRE